MNIKHYADSQRAKLATVLEREELSCWYRSTVQGPLTLTWRLLPHNPDSATIKRLLSLGSVLQSAMLVESVRVQQVAGMIEIQIPSPQPMTPNAANMLTGSSGLSVAMGWDAMCKPVAVDLSRHGAIAWVGPSRRGKTQSMRATLYALTAQNSAVYSVVICQRSKLDDWAAFDRGEQSLGVVTDAKEIERCLQWFAERTRIGRAKGREFVILIDDLPSILDMCDITKPLATIAGVGAGVGIHALLGTQALGSNAGSGGQLVESNVTARVVYKPASRATGARNAGSGGLSTDDLSAYPGDALLLVDGHPERIATARCADSTVEKLEAGGPQYEYFIWSRMSPDGVVTKPVTKAVTEPVNGAVNGGCTRVQGVGAVTSDPFRLPGGTEPNSLQRQKLYAEWKRLGSKNATMQAVFGGKNGRYLEWLNWALEENQDVHANK